MLLNNSHNDPEVKRKVNELVGQPFSLMERFKMNGVGSPKMEITASSIEIHNFLILDQNTNTCNIEMRPTGIIIGFQKRLETYILVIPYYKLAVYKGKSDEYSFHKDNYFIKVKAKEKDLKIHKFISKILTEQENQRPTRLEDL